MAEMLRAGTMKELEQADGDWLFLDVGFAKGGNKTSGWLFVPQPLRKRRRNLEPECLSYGDMVKKAVDLAEEPGSLLNIVIEAPLSAAFDASGSPMGRNGDKVEVKTRYWYCGPACPVFIAALYLLQALKKARIKREVRLFEGFVSFKSSGKQSNHAEDVRALMSVVRSGGKSGGRFLEAEPAEG